MRAAGQKLTKLEALRGAAAFYVMLSHTFSNCLIIGGKDLSILMDFGQEAVILFFVLSGFVIQYSFERSKDKSFSVFFSKRFFRIYIPLVIVFLTNYILLCFQRGGIFNPDWLELTGNIFMLQDAEALKPNVICSFFLGNSPLWSLSYEWWFYMLFFLIATRYRKQASSIIYITGIIATASYLLYPNFVNRILMYMSIWWAGADMAMLYLRGAKIDFKSLRISLLVLLAEIVLLIMNVYFNKEKIANELGYSTIGVSPYLELRHFSFAFISVFAAIIWQKLHWVLFSRTVGLFEPFAKISFGVYISHWFLVAKASYLDGFVGNVYLRYTLYFGVCFCFSYIVERKIYPYFNNKFLNSMRHKEKKPALANELAQTTY
ncbi:MAG TPA: acyltransferase [Chitinophagaceae bacterium]|nr:acyltransferase [Chitinophagaceae bacterium]